jgi:Lrp/AsnC family leucine-responsive transcriptional regulator
MKTTDMKIMQHIRQNARMNLTAISRKTGIPVSTIFDRLQAHEGSFITKFTALVDFAKLGFPVRANVFLKVDPQSRDGIRNHLLVHQSVNNLYRINNGYDFAAECVFTSIKEVEEFVEALEMQFKVLDKHVFHIIDDIAREKVLTV